MEKNNPTPALETNRIIRTQTPDGLVVFELNGEFGSAKFSPQGAHLMEFTPAGGKPLLFLSKQTALTRGKAIRGGIPVIFPWFGARAGHPESPMHGLVRTRVWEVASLEVPENRAAKIRMTFESNPETLSIWPYAFRLALDFTLGRNLVIRWETHNMDQSPFLFEQALHPYFPVSDVRSAGVEGLKGIRFIDKTDGLRLREDVADAVLFTAETDRLYLDTDSKLFLNDPGSFSRLGIDKVGSRSSVVWNPWIAKAASLPDLGDEEWREFVCVEQANAANNAVTLAPGEVHTLEVGYGWCD